MEALAQLDLPKPKTVPRVPSRDNMIHDLFRLPQGTAAPFIEKATGKLTETELRRPRIPCWNPLKMYAGSDLGMLICT